MNIKTVVMITNYRKPNLIQTMKLATIIRAEFDQNSLKDEFDNNQPNFILRFLFFS